MDGGGKAVGNGCDVPGWRLPWRIMSVRWDGFQIRFDPALGVLPRGKDPDEGMGSFQRECRSIVLRIDQVLERFDPTFDLCHDLVELQ